MDTNQKRPMEDLDEAQFDARYLSSDAGPKQFFQENLTHDDWMHLGSMAFHGEVTEEGITIRACVMLEDVLIMVHYLTFGIRMRDCPECMTHMAANSDTELTHDNVDAIKWKT